MKTRLRALLLLGLAVGASAAGAQWVWTDAKGQRVYSDLPPPAGTPESAVLRRPGAAVMTPADAAPRAVAAPAPTARSSTAAAVDPVLETRRQQAEASRDAEQRAQKERYEKARADSCARARQAQAQLNGGQRLYRTGPDGVKEYLDEAARQAEAQRLAAIMAADCP